MFKTRNHDYIADHVTELCFVFLSPVPPSLSLLFLIEIQKEEFVFSCHVFHWSVTRTRSKRNDYYELSANEIQVRRYGISFWTSRGAINKVDNRAFSITDRRLIVLWTGTMLIRFWKIISFDFLYKR